MGGCCVLICVTNREQQSIFREHTREISTKTEEIHLFLLDETLFCVEMCALNVVYVQKLIPKKTRVNKKKTPICFHGVSKCGVLQSWRPFRTLDMHQKAQVRPNIQQLGEYADVAQLSRLWQHLETPNQTATVACLRPHTVNKSINPSPPSLAETQIGQLTVWNSV